MNALGPPMEQRGGANALGLGLQGGAAGKLGVFEVLDRGEVLIDERGVAQRPEVLGGLQLGRIGWQKEQVHVVGHAQAQTGVPAGAIEDEHDLLAGARPRLTGKLGQLHFKERDADRGRQMEEGAA